jgi:2-desacetyl-2-hydroxyethyl bacteriochlorophyllide A dehydrogenase
LKTIQLTSQGTPGKLELREVPDPQPGPGEVVVEVHACGLNHIDLWTEAGGLPMPIELPRIPGGEVAGRVAEIGGEVAGCKSGDAVAIQSNIFCGQCEFCRRGDESICLFGKLLGVDLDGGFAEKVLVPARTLVRLPEGLDFDTSAALTLAGSTAMHMLANRAQVRKGDWVLVMGASSGVGSAGIQIARELGARVITTASNEAKAALGKTLGAEFVIDSNDPQWPSKVRKITQRRGVDLILEHVGGEVLTRSFECLARGGTIVTCGATTGRDVRLNIWPLFVKQQRLIGSYGRNRADLETTLQWAAQGKLKPVIDSTFPLERAREAFEKLRSRKVLGKILLKPLQTTSSGA